MKPSYRLHQLRAVETGGAARKAASAASDDGPDIAALPAPSTPQRRLRSNTGPRLLPYVDDREFMPPAIGLAETPPSPIKIALMLSICLLAALALVWSWFGRIDIFATARGQIEPVNHVKVLQPLESGRISGIKVAEGQVVKAGDVLLELDHNVADAELAAATKAEIGARAEAQRRAAAISMVRSRCMTCWEEPGWTEDIPPVVRQREDGVLRGDVDEALASLSNLSDQQNEKAASIAQSARNIDVQKRLLATLQERVGMRQVLLDSNVGSRAGVIDATQSLREAEVQVATEQGRHDLALAALPTIKSERQRVVSAFLADQTRKMSDARRLAEQKGAERLGALARVDHMTLRAPASGMVQNLTVTTLGQVVVAGQELLRIVPSDDRLVVRAYVSNEDVGFVGKGQAATIKVDAFPFTRYGTLEGRIVSVSQDAVPAATADSTLVDHTRTDGRFDQALTPSARAMTDLRFATMLDVQSLRLPSGEEPIVARPGMTVTVEIRTGSRRIIDYILSPLTEIKAGALHDR